LNPARKVALACAAAALGVGGIAAATSLSARDWRLSALVRMSGSEPMAALARQTDPGFSFVHPQAHYDGVYFYAIARDPFARGDEHTKLDRAAYRYGHPGYGWLAWLVSAGRPGGVPAALFIVGLAGVAVAGYASSRLSEQLGWTPWGGLVVAVTPGIVFAITADTSEPVALAFASLGLLAWLREERRWAAAALAAGCFVKEPLLLVPAGLLLWELVRWARGGGPADLARRALPLLVGPLLYAGWYVYLRSTFGEWPFRQEAADYFAFPLYGWIDSMRRAASLAAQTFDRMQVGNAAVALIATVAVLLLIGLVRAARWKTPLDPVFILLALLVLSLNWLGVLYPKDLIRETAVPMALLPAVIAGARRIPEPAEPAPPR
jgi:hypothetical protein